jgi:ankyrin repeat protein
MVVALLVAEACVCYSLSAFFEFSDYEFDNFHDNRSEVISNVNYINRNDNGVNDDNNFVIYDNNNIKEIVNIDIINNIENIKKYIVEGAYVNLKNNLNGCTPLIYFVVYASKQDILFLIEKMQHTTKTMMDFFLWKDDRGLNALHYSIMRGDEEIIELLLIEIKNKISVNRINNGYNNNDEKIKEIFLKATEIAKEKNVLSVVTLLLKYYHFFLSHSSLLK